MEFQKTITESEENHYKFVFIPRGFVTGHVVFLNDEMADEYKKRTKSKSDDTSINPQQKNPVTPLLSYTYNSWRYKSAEISKAVPPQTGKFNEKEHFQKYGDVQKTSRSFYTMYTIRLPSTTTTLYHHERYPIMDFEINGVKYRWVSYHEHHWLTNTKPYVYALYELDPDQISLVDGLIDREVDKNNGLVAGLKPAIFKKPTAGVGTDFVNFTSDKKLGQFKVIYNNPWTNRCKAELEIDFKEEIKGPLDLGDTAMTFLSIASVIKGLEDVKQMHRNFRTGTGGGSC